MPVHRHHLPASSRLWDCGLLRTWTASQRLHFNVVGAHDGEGLAVGDVLDFAGGNEGPGVRPGAQVLGQALVHELGRLGG